MDELLALLGCSTLDEWKNLLFTIAATNGFKNVLFGMVKSKSHSLESAILISDYPKKWRETYHSMQLHHIDPTVKHCLTSALPISWNGSLFSSQPQSAFYEQASSFGLRSGMTFPIHGVNGEFGVLSFVSDSLGKGTAETHHNGLAKMTLIRDYIVESSTKMMSWDIPKAIEPRLTPKELECLKWIAIGKSSWETAQILRCSEATINFHVSNLKVKFGVRSRQQVIVKAIKTGLVIPS